VPERVVRVLADHPYRCAVVSLVACALAAWAGYGAGMEGLHALTRFTGRAGLWWFAVIFVLAAKHRFADAAQARDGLRIVLGFGLHHTVHLALLLAYLHASGHSLNVSRAAGGMFGYVLLFAMMATANESARERLGATRWRTLHQASLWYLWIVFVLTYLPRVLGKLPDVGGGPLEFAAGLSLLAALALYRLGASVKGKIRTHPPAPAR